MSIKQQPPLQAEFDHYEANEQGIIERPPWRDVHVQRAPAIREIYWVEFWQDARLPEMWKKRPGIVISARNSLRGVVTIIPTSSNPQDRNPWAIRLKEPLKANDVPSWAVCNQVCTVSVSRLQTFRGKVPKMEQAEFDQVVELLMKLMPNPRGP